MLALAALSITGWDNALQRTVPPDRARRSDGKFMR